MVWLILSSQLLYFLEINADANFIFSYSAKANEKGKSAAVALKHHIKSRYQLWVWLCSQLWALLCSWIRLEFSLPVPTEIMQDDGGQIPRPEWVSMFNLECNLILKQSRGSHLHVLIAWIFYKHWRYFTLPDAHHTLLPCKCLFSHLDNKPHGCKDCICLVHCHIITQHLAQTGQSKISVDLKKNFF